MCFTGNAAVVLATLDLITELVVRNPEDELITTYESQLVGMLNKHSYDGLTGKKTVSLDIK